MTQSYTSLHITTVIQWHSHTQACTPWLSFSVTVIHKLAHHNFHSVSHKLAHNDCHSVSQSYKSLHITTVIQWDSHTQACTEWLSFSVTVIHKLAQNDCHSVSQSYRSLQATTFIQWHISLHRTTFIQGHIWWHSYTQACMRRLSFSDTVTHKLAHHDFHSVSHKLAHHDFHTVTQSWTSLHTGTVLVMTSTSASGQQWTSGEDSRLW